MWSNVSILHTAMVKMHNINALQVYYITICIFSNENVSSDYKR